MRTTRLLFAGLGLYLLLAGLLVAAQTTPPPTAGKFGLTTAPVKPAATTATAAVAPSTSASAPSSPPAPAAAPTTAGGFVPGENIVAALAYGTLAKQGKLANGSKIECVKYHFDEGQSLDPNSGLPTGKKTSQLTITKQWDAASLQLLQALSTNETIQTLTVEFLGHPAVTGNGKEAPVFTVTLTNASVAGIHQYLENKVALEDVVLTYSKMNMTTQNKSTSVDNWASK